MSRRWQTQSVKIPVRYKKKLVSDLNLVTRTRRSIGLSRTEQEMKLLFLVAHDSESCCYFSNQKSGFLFELDH